MPPLTGSHRSEDRRHRPPGALCGRRADRRVTVAVACGLAAAGSPRGHRGLAGRRAFRRRFRGHGRAGRGHPVRSGQHRPAMLRACLSLLRAQYASPAGAAAGIAGGLLAVAVLGRVTWVYGSAATAARRCRAAHDDVLAVIARPGPAADVRIIDNDHPAVYCLPGHRRIVVTTGALTRLDSGQLDAVLAHERAHLSERHHLLLALATALARAFPAVRFFAVAAQQITYLVEVAADDAAVRRAPRLTVAAALLAVANAGVPVGSLGAGGVLQRSASAVSSTLRSAAAGCDRWSRTRR